MRRFALGLALAAFLAGPALGQVPSYPAGPTNQSSLALTAPTPPTATNNNQIATTAWVNNFSVGSLPLASGKIFIGSVGGLAVAQTPSGDWTISNAGLATLATVNANVGTFGSATSCVTVTANAKGLTTAISAATCTPAIGSITGLGSGVATWAATPSSANLRAALTDETGTGLAYFQGGDIGTPSAGVGTNLTGVPIGSGISGLAAGVAAWAATPSSANLRTALTDETGTGLAYFQGGDIGTPSAGVATNITALNATQLTTGTMPAARLGLSQITNSLGADVLMTPASTVKDGPSIAQGATGTWFASGTVTVIDPTNVNGRIFCKLWDGTTIIASSAMLTPPVATTYATMSLSGFLASPAGNIRISCQNLSFATASIAFNQTGSSKDSTVTAFRIN